jgi:glycerate kinase
MLQALGARFLDGRGVPLRAHCGGGSLSAIATVDFSLFDRRLDTAHFDLACDVDNPLCGERGAAAVFGPQKGASPADVAMLDQGLIHLYALMEDVLGRQVVERPGAGAAGGLGAAMLLCLQANLRPGIEVVIDASGLADLLTGADLVVTGEGRVDEQTLFGKAPAGVARLARACGVPVIAVGGSLASVEALWKSGLFDAIEAAVCRPCSVADALSSARSNLTDAGIRIGMWLSFSPFAHKSL